MQLKRPELAAGVGPRPDGGRERRKRGSAQEAGIHKHKYL